MRSKFLTLFVTAFCLASPALAGDVLFSVDHRKAQLQSPAYAKAKEYCLAKKVQWDSKMPTPIAGLKTTKGYGSDKRAAEFSYYVMVLGGRAMAGDSSSANALKDALLTWAKANAFTKGDSKHDTYYALKRHMLPVIVSLSIIDSDLTSGERSTITKWIDRIVPPLDKRFDGDVDVNNHRYMADAVLMAWGAYKGDATLYHKGTQGFKTMLHHIEADGSLPMETRRGARALWYMRHALTSLVVIAQMDNLRGGQLYNTAYRGRSLSSVMHYFVSASHAPLTILPLASKNYIPGPHKDYLVQDTGHLKMRGHNRHYMAFSQIYKQQPTLAAKRLSLLVDQFETPKSGHPYIDDYAGGNMSCFFWEPKGNS